MRVPISPSTGYRHSPTGCPPIEPPASAGPPSATSYGDGMAYARPSNRPERPQVGP